MRCPLPMSSKPKAKILVIGPTGCGKTRLANSLAGVDDSPNLEASNPTQGVRILEFDKDVAAGGGRMVRLQVELWDTSGDKKFQNCWAAILKDAHGVVLVYDPSVKTQEKEVENWYKAYVTPLKLKDEQVVLFAHSHDPSAKSRLLQPPRALEQFPIFSTQIDDEERKKACVEGFDRLLKGVLPVAVEASRADLSGL